MLTNVIFSFGLRKCKVLKLISWKHSFKRLNEEYEIAKKKKQALDNLFESGRISQATRDSFDNDINAVIMEIEKQQKDLLAKMQGKAQELEGQIKTLETLLANYEIQHVVGEIDEEIYQREINLLSTGLESAKHELDIIKEATNQISPPVEATTTEPSLPAEENEAEVVQNEPVENVSDAPEEVEAATEPATQEPVITVEEAVPEEPAIESAETMPEETQQAVDETPEVVEDQPEVTEELSQNVEEIEDQPEITEETQQAIEETPEVIEDEPQVVEETLQTAEETPEEAHPSEAPEEAPQEISVEAIAEEEQSDEEASADAETDEDTENQDL